jgi:hypothetical protein
VGSFVVAVVGEVVGGAVGEADGDAVSWRLRRWFRRRLCR